MFTNYLIQNSAYEKIAVLYSVSCGADLMASFTDK